MSGRWLPPPRPVPPLGGSRPARPRSGSRCSTSSPGSRPAPAATPCCPRRGWTRGATSVWVAGGAGRTAVGAGRARWASAPSSCPGCGGRSRPLADLGALVRLVAAAAPGALRHRPRPLGQGRRARPGRRLPLPHARRRRHPARPRPVVARAGRLPVRAARGDAPGPGRLPPGGASPPSLHASGSSPSRPPSPATACSPVSPTAGRIDVAASAVDLYGDPGGQRPRCPGRARRPRRRAPGRDRRAPRRAEGAARLRPDGRRGLGDATPTRASS